MLTLYRIVLYAAFPVVLARLLMRISRSRQYSDRWSQRFGLGLQAGGSPACGRRIWVHAVSVGEVNAAIPLVRALQTDDSERQIVITTMTPTGSDRVARTFHDTVDHFYLPYDYPGAVKRFLNRLNPCMAIMMETEIWPNYIVECHDRNIPVIYANTRLSRKSCRGYRMFKKLVSPILEKVDYFAVQTRADSQRLISLGANPDRVQVTGSLKFELDIPASALESAQSVRRNLGPDRPVLVAGSTREGEEAHVLRAFSEVKRRIPDLLLVLVPRHPERFRKVYRLCLRSKYKTALRTRSSGAVGSDVDIYVGDTMGELGLLIAASDIAYIGGSLVPAGGHNLLEACAASVAVIFGPHMFNFQEISDMVLEKGAGVQVVNTRELTDVIIRFVNEPALRNQYGSRGKGLVDENKGALFATLKIIERLSATAGTAT